jgi:hypothetical protein
MPSPSPTCTVKDGAGSPQATLDGVDVTAGNTITIQLASLAGVRGWSIAVVGRDDAVASPALTVNYTTCTATFTAPAAPWALIFQSQVNGGVDLNGQAQASYTTTFGVFGNGSGNARLMAVNERTEGSAAFGWITKINALLRTLVGGVPIAGATVTTDATVTTIATIAVADNTNIAIEVYAGAKKAATATKAFFAYRQKYYRNGGAPTAWGTSPESIGTDADGNPWTVTFAVSGNNVLVKITGAAATTIKWQWEVKTLVSTN